MSDEAAPECCTDKMRGVRSWGLGMKGGLWREHLVEGVVVPGVGRGEEQWVSSPHVTPALSEGCSPRYPGPASSGRLGPELGGEVRVQMWIWVALVSSGPVAWM